jgi:hypothetical protein
MDAAAAGLIGAFGGAAIGFGGAVKVGADQRRETLRMERNQALAAYLGALYPAVGELREMPANKGADPLSKAIDRVSGEQATWARTRKGLVAISPHLFGRIDRLSLALARLQLLEMPGPVMEAVEAANDYVAELGEERSAELLARWPTIRAELLSAAELLDGKPHGWWWRPGG